MISFHLFMFTTFPQKHCLITPIFIYIYLYWGIFLLLSDRIIDNIIILLSYFQSSKQMILSNRPFMILNNWSSEVCQFKLSDLILTQSRFSTKFTFFRFQNNEKILEVPIKICLVESESIIVTSQSNFAPTFKYFDFYLYYMDDHTGSPWNQSLLAKILKYLWEN